MTNYTVRRRKNRTPWPEQDLTLAYCENLDKVREFTKGLNEGLSPEEVERIYVLDENEKKVLKEW